MYGALRTYDLPDLLAAVSPRRAAVVAPVDCAGRVLEKASAETTYAFPTAHYAKGQLSLVPGPLSPDATVTAVVDWLERA